MCCTWLSVTTLNKNFNQSTSVKLISCGCVADVQHLMYIYDNFYKICLLAQSNILLTQWPGQKQYLYKEILLALTLTFWQPTIIDVSGPPKWKIQMSEFTFISVHISPWQFHKATKYRQTPQIDRKDKLTVYEQNLAKDESLNI